MLTAASPKLWTPWQRRPSVAGRARRWFDGLFHPSLKYDTGSDNLVYRPATDKLVYACGAFCDKCDDHHSFNSFTVSISGVTNCACAFELTNPGADSTDPSKISSGSMNGTYSVPFFQMDVDGSCHYLLDPGPSFDVKLYDPTINDPGPPDPCDAMEPPWTTISVSTAMSVWKGLNSLRILCQGVSPALGDNKVFFSGQITTGICDDTQSIPNDEDCDENSMTSGGTADVTPDV